MKGFTRKINKAGVDLIKSFESCRLKAYDDGVGVWTIGWGTTKGVKPGMTITQAQADKLFADELAEFAEGVNELVKSDVNDNEFAALVSLAYNIGLSALKRSSLLRAVNRGDFDTAANEFLKWNKGGGKVMRGLTRRRQAERKLFLTPSKFSLASSEPVEKPTLHPENNIGAEISSTAPQAQSEQAIPPTQTVEATGTGTQVNISPDTKPIVSTSPFDNVFELAQTGFGSMSKKLTTGAITGGVGSAIFGFFQNNWVGIVAGVALAIFLIACGVGIFLFAQYWGNKKKLKEAEIRSDPQKHNVAI